MGGISNVNDIASESLYEIHFWWAGVYIFAFLSYEIHIYARITAWYCLAADKGPCWTTSRPEPSHST